MAITFLCHSFLTYRRLFLAPCRMYCTAMEAIRRAITRVITNDPFLPSTRYMGWMYLRVSHTAVKVSNTDIRVISSPEDCKFRMEAVMAPGPTNRGHPMGTAPIPSESVCIGFHPPRTRSWTATIRRSMPPAIMKLLRVMPNKDKMFWPTTVKKVSNIKPVTVAKWKVCSLSWSFISRVSSRKMGTLPRGSTMISKATVVFTTSAVNAVKSIFFPSSFCL